jgi:hypothetical protein
MAPSLTPFPGGGVDSFTIVTAGLISNSVRAGAVFVNPIGSRERRDIPVIPAMPAFHDEIHPVNTIPGLKLRFNDVMARDFLHFPSAIHLSALLWGLARSFR